MFFSENACCYCQPLSSTLPVTLLFVHPLAELLKCCFCGSEGASMTDFHDLQLKEQLLLQQKWEDDVDVDEGNVCDFCVRSVKPNKFFDQTKWVICMQWSMVISISAFLNGHLFEM